MICPSCDKIVSEDNKRCPFCKVKLWSPQVLKTWNRMEILLENVND